MLHQIALICIIALGFIIGYILPSFTQEEMMPGKKYFKALETALAIGIFVAALTVYYSPLTILITAVVCGLCLSIGFPRRIIIVYPFLLMLLLYKPESVIVSLGFLYGLPAGTLYKIS